MRSKAISKRSQNAVQATDSPRSRPMSVVLMVTNDCPSCREAQAIWAGACAELGLDLQCRDEGHVVKSIPLLVINGVPVFAGVPEPRQALQVLSRFLDVQSPGDT